jgi:hypothetical protein
MLLDPILNVPHSDFEDSQEKFRKKTVNRYLAHTSSTKREPRYYRQLEIRFDPLRVKTLLRKFLIPTEVTVLVIGGYTGHFAKALQNVGMKVIFTDPLREWVSEAEKSGLEAHQYRAEDIPGSLLERAQLIATFECYPALGHRYDVFRFFSRDYGVLFVESEATRNELKAESNIEDVELTDDFSPFQTVYSVAIVTRKNKDLVFHHFHASNHRSKDKILTDAKVMKALHDSLPTKSIVTIDSCLSIPNIAMLGISNLTQSLRRIRELYRLDLVEACYDRYEIQDELSNQGVPIGSKRFFFA